MVPTNTSMTSFIFEMLYEFAAMVRDSISEAIEQSDLDDDTIAGRLARWHQRNAATAARYFQARCR
jgi:hypothetical protein